MEENNALNNFNFHDFTNDNNWEQIIELLSGDNGIVDSIPCHNQIFDELNQDTGFANNGLPGLNYKSISDPNSFPESTTLPLNGAEEDGEENEGDDYSSGTTTTMRGVDRSRTLVAERRRRGRMKEKLYALRSLVPNITKMDKASIIGDAVLYVQDLQKQAKKFRAEIAGLESSLRGVAMSQESIENPMQTHVLDSNQLISKNIVQVDLFQLEERSFYVRLVCNKGQGVVVALYKAVESLTCFHIQSSNFTTLPDRFVLTLTLHVREGGEEMNASTVKLWVMGALLSQGFEFTMPVA
ncbi:FER-like regulator of iron uptake [Tasmannia lanceolata]|uniref:FER-like regulator of iron uptake n=1 Tax=Tasmannia lanceolata TaxID=3420 RepID=UPI004063422B